jgi:hypothetical protein
MTFGVILRLEETEARALLALTEYGTKEFLTFFYKNLGTVGLKPNEQGLINLFETIKAELPKHLDKMDKSRKVWGENFE